MRATAGAVIAGLLVASGCGSGAKETAHYTTTPPTTGGPSSQPVAQRSLPPFATARIREEVQVARASNPRLFSIFLKVPGERRCAIPDGAPSPRVYYGICKTSVRSRPTHEPSVSVTFTESWPPCPRGAGCIAAATRHHTWQVIEGEPIITAGAKLHVYATHSKGAKAPQLAWPRIGHAVQVARASDRYLSIFPAEPGSRRCAIPDGAPGTKAFRGKCSTSLSSVVSHGPSTIVTFTERWGQPASCPANGYCLVPFKHHATWKVSLVASPPRRLHVLATGLSGATPPQLYK